MHELKYMKQGYNRRPYCVCGWLGKLEHLSGSEMSNMFRAQDQFVEHLQSLDND